MKYLFTLFLLISFLAPSMVFGADLVFSSEDHPRGARISVFLDPQGETINAIEGVFTIVGSNPITIERSQGIVSLWVEPPIIEGESITFAGIIPGGFSGLLTPRGVREPGEIFSFIVVGIGTTTIKSEKIRGFIHDGRGTEMAIAPNNITVVTEESSRISVTTDFIPPTGFEASFISDSSFDGKEVFAFYAFDNDIAYFEIKETLGTWKRVQSPYVLKSLIPWSVSLRAVDYAGNTHTKKFPNPRKSNLLFIIGGMLTVLVIIFGIMRIRNR